MARPGGLELPTFWFVARRSIQLSYGRAVDKYYHRLAPGIQQRGKITICLALRRTTLAELPAGNKEWSESTRRIAGMLRCGVDEAAVVRFGATPEQGGQRQYGGQLKSGQSPLIAKMNMKRELNGICRRGQQYSQLIG